MSNWSDSTSECYRNEFMFLHSILWIFGYKCNLFFAYFAANIRKNLLRILSNGILFFILQKNQWERLCNAVLMIGHSLWQYHFCKNNFLVNFRILVNFWESSAERVTGDLLLIFKSIWNNNSHHGIRELLTEFDCVRKRRVFFSWENTHYILINVDVYQISINRNWF